MRIGLFGGSFNPIHNRHVDIVKHVLEENLVDEIWLIPCKDHAFDKKFEDIKHRLNMIKLSIKNLDNVKINDIELKLKGKSYTINTVRLLKKKHPGYEFFFIAGSDILNEIKRWHKYGELEKEIDFIIIKRDNDSISSTEIREKIKNNNTLKGLVPEEVAKYIKGNNLYK